MMRRPPRSPWHSGERDLQQRAGVAERMEAFGRKVIRDHLPEQHREFYRQLPFLVLAAVDASGDAWATIVEAKTNLAFSSDPKTLQINVLPRSDDPADAALRLGDAIGVLGIELQSRRRNRVNGNVIARNDRELTLLVEHAFGNCPQYIQTRQFSFAADSMEYCNGNVEKFTQLDDAATAMIRGADTFFMASYVDIDGEKNHRQIDASHRGGKPGFVRIDDNVLTVPDFAGNLHFNTLGNLHVNPRAGLVFVDFSNGDLLQITGRTEIVFDGSEVDSFQGAERLWRLYVEKVVRRPAALKLRWQLEDFSPNSLMTGSWEQAEARQQANVLRDTWRRFSVARIVDESATIKSFYLQPGDAAGFAQFKAGQHLPIRVAVTPGSAPLIRTYTLSTAPSDGYYRISVKREGLVSRYLHDQIKLGDDIEVRAPLGGFVVDANQRRPLVLLSAGVGITPLLAMLREVVYEGLRKRRVRKTVFVHCARTKAERAFDSELLELLQRGGEAIQALRLLSRPEPDAIEGEDYELQGRIDIPLLNALLAFDDYDFYLCGPSSFTQDIYDGLRAMRIPDDRIHAEQFGPSTLRRNSEVTAPKNALATVPAADAPVRVQFSLSAKEACWQPGSGSLLELAEARGLTPEFSCRGGSCGTCKTKLIAGQVSYASPPGIALAADEILLCCSVPAHVGHGDDDIVLDL